MVGRAWGLEPGSGEPGFCFATSRLSARPACDRAG